MTTTPHEHRWTTLHGSKLICHTCDTVSEIDVLLSNIAAAARKQSKIDTLSSQLFAGELKKDARDKYYAWVIQNNPDAIKPKHTQESLL